MVIIEHLTIDGRAFTKTYSDAGRYVVRDGISYDAAYDPAELRRTYTEGEVIVPEDYDVDGDDALDILFGGAV